MKPRHVRLTGSGIGQHQLLIDGHDIATATAGAVLRIAPGELPELEVDLHVLELDTDLGDARVLIPDWTRDALVALGWTPPADEATA